MRLTKLQCRIIDCVISMPLYNWDTLVSQLPEYKMQDIYSACLGLPSEFVSVIQPIMGGKIAVLTLTHQGRNYRELERLENHAKWKERFIGFGFGLALWGVEEFIVWLLSR